MRYLIFAGDEYARTIGGIYNVLIVTEGYETDAYKRDFLDHLHTDDPDYFYLKDTAPRQKQLINENWNGTKQIIKDGVMRETFEWYHIYDLSVREIIAEGHI